MENLQTSGKGKSLVYFNSAAPSFWIKQLPVCFLTSYEYFCQKASVKSICKQELGKVSSELSVFKSIPVLRCRVP